MIFELLVVLVPLLLFYHFYWKRKDLPPGPIPLPIFGNLLSIILGFPGYEVLKKWSKQYGPIYTVWFTEMHGIMITDYKLMIETFQKCGDAYAGRTYTDSFNKIMREGNYGVIHTEGDLWQEHRRFALHFLRDFGLGKNIMEERILGEVADFIVRIKSEVQNGIKEHELWDHLQTSVGSIINALLFGYRFEGEKLKEYKQVKEYLDEMLKILTNPSILMMHKNTELFKYVPFFRGQYYGIVESRKRLFGFFDKQIEEHLKELNFDSAPTDYVDAFLREKAKRDAEGLPHTFHTVQLYNMCFDLWFAGQETTSSTLSWGMVYLMLNPEIQEKLHQELDKVIGNDRLVTLEDKKNLPYTNAVINETQRLFNILPINMPHKVTEDVEINGYLIKKGTTIVPQISNVLYDDKLFPEPYKFKPERFLTEDGQLKKCDELIPFSIGKRQCLGEGLARMELFLFTANIYNQFRISSVDGQPPSVVKKLGAAFAPQPYVCKIESKH